MPAEPFQIIGLTDTPDAIICNGKRFIIDPDPELRESLRLDRMTVPSLHALIAAATEELMIRDMRSAGNNTDDYDIEGVSVPSNTRRTNLLNLADLWDRG